MTRAANETEKLVRTIGFWGLVLMCINAVVGSGVFLLPSESFRLLGPFSLWAPLLFSLPVFILVLCFAEATSHFTKPGGAYLYTRTAFGDFVGFETGWMNWIARVTSLAALSNGFVVSIARLHPPAGEGAFRLAIIVGSLAVLAIIHALGVRYGAGTIYLFTWGKLLPLIGFIIVALIAFNINPVPASFTIPGEGTNWSEAALLLLFAYAGFENLGVPAGEFKNPKRDLPMALLIGIIAIAVLYSLAQLAAMSAVADLSTSTTPIADAAAALIGPIGAIIITVGALLSMAGTNSGTMLEGSRMLFALSTGRRNVGPIARVHEKFRTPIVAITIHALTAMVIAAGGSFAKLAVMSAVARMTTYLFTCAAVPKLRAMSKNKDGFRLPAGPLIPILGVLLSLVLFATLATKHLIAAAIALTVGAILYLVTKPATPEATNLEEELT